MHENGYIKLYRSIMDWEWYKTTTVKAVFVHLLLSANYRPQRFCGILVGRGQTVTSYQRLADGCGLSISQVRTAISHLKKTGEISVRTTNRYQIITITNYDRFQGQCPEPDTHPGHGAQGLHGTPAQANRTQSAANNNINKDNIDIFINYAKGDKRLLLALRAFEDMRLARKNPLTHRARELLCARLDQLAAQGEDVAACLDAAVMYGWQWVYPLAQYERAADGVRTRSARLLPCERQPYQPALKQPAMAKKTPSIYNSGRYDYDETESLLRQRTVAAADRVR